MKKLKCNLGFHKYETIGNQMVRNTVGGFSMVQLNRVVNKCKICGKVSFFGYDIATNAHNDETLDWNPKLKY